MTSMYTLNGQLVHAFCEKVVNRETGEERSVHRIQVMGSMPTRDGDASRYDMDTLTVPDHRPYKELVGKRLRVPIGLFSPGGKTVIKFVPKGTKPEVIE